MCGVGAGLGEFGTTCVSPWVEEGLASRDGDPSRDTMTAAFVMSEEEFYTAKLTAPRRRSSSTQRVPRDVSMSAIKYSAVFAAAE